MKIDAVLALGIDAAIGVLDRGDNRLPRRQVASRGVGVGNGFGSELTGKLAGSVGPHSVGDDKQVPAASLLFVVVGERDGKGVLIAAAPHAHVAHRGAAHTARRLR